MNYSPFIYAFEQNNIAVTGTGVLDGQADSEHWWPMRAKAKADADAPVAKWKGRLSVSGSPENSCSIWRICISTVRACSASRRAARRGHQMLAPPNEEFGLQMVGQRMHLQADSAGRQVVLLSRLGYARFLDHDQK